MGGSNTEQQKCFYIYTYKYMYVCVTISLLWVWIRFYHLMDYSTSVLFLGYQNVRVAFRNKIFKINITKQRKIKKKE